MKSERERMHERHVGKYTDILFAILCRKDPDNGTNYFLKLQGIAREQHYGTRGIMLDSYEAGIQVQRTVKEFAAQCLKDGSDPAGFKPREIFERVEPILLERLGKL